MIKYFCMAADVAIRVSYTVEKRPSLKRPNYTNVLYCSTYVSIPGVPSFNSRAHIIGCSPDLADIVDSMEVHPDARKPIIEKGSCLRTGQKATVEVHI